MTIAGYVNRPSSLPQFPQTSGAAAVTASVTAAVRESLMLSAPADAMLSSALFADFTREVAARIIQHYWREHTNRRLTVQDCCTASVTPQQNQQHHTEQEADLTGQEAELGAVGPDTNQEELLADAMMRYRRKNGTEVAASCNSTQQVTTSRLQVKRGHSWVARTSTACAARVSCHTDASFDQAEAGMSSLDKLKQRQGKQRRLERPTAQHAKHALKAGAELPEALQQDSSAVVMQGLPVAASTQHAQQAPCSREPESICAAEPAKPDLLTDSSRGLEQEGSDGAPLHMLNPGQHVRNTAPSIEPLHVSTDGIPLQCHQHQQEPINFVAVHDASGAWLGSDENVSPNLSPDKLHAKPPSNQTQPVQASAAAAPGFVHQEPNPNICKMESEHARDSAADGTASHAKNSNGQRQKSDRLSSNKLADIFAFLDGVEAQAEAEAADVAQSHAAHKSSLYDLAPATSALFHRSSSFLDQSPSTTHGHQQQQHHLEQKVNRPVDSSMSRRGQAPAHEAACSSSVPTPGGSQATGTDHGRTFPVAAFRQQTKAAHGQAWSNTTCTETGSTGH